GGNTGGASPALAPASIATLRGRAPLPAAARRDGPRAGAQKDEGPGESDRDRALVRHGAPASADGSARAAEPRARPYGAPWGSSSARRSTQRGRVGGEPPGNGSRPSSPPL